MCDELSACQITIFISRNTEYNESLYGRYGTKVTMKMDSLPTERFHRKVVRSRLELVGEQMNNIYFK